MCFLGLLSKFNNLKSSFDYPIIYTESQIMKGLNIYLNILGLFFGINIFSLMIGRGHLVHLQAS